MSTIGSRRSATTPHRLNVLELLGSLISLESVTPEDAGCMPEIIVPILEALGFTVTWLNNGAVTNLYAERGEGPGGLLIVGHTDVVPVGEGWSHSPFAATIVEGRIYGRGATDMKGPLAAALKALYTVVHGHGDSLGRIGIILTSTEENPSHDGTSYVVKQLGSRLASYECALVTESSSAFEVGDRIKVGARGVDEVEITVTGVDGHVGYVRPDMAAIPSAARAIVALRHLDFSGYDAESPVKTELHATYVHGGSCNALNVVPTTCRFGVDVRYSPGITWQRVRELVEETARSAISSEHCSIQFQWRGKPGTGDPWLSGYGPALDVVDEVIEQVTGRKPKHSTEGGTGDGRFLPKDIGVIFELGSCTDADNMHKPNEFVGVQELLTLVRIYRMLFERLLVDSRSEG